MNARTDFHHVVAVLKLTSNSNKLVLPSKIWYCLQKFLKQKERKFLESGQIENEINKPKVH
jgi:hypothetical protein